VATWRPWTVVRAVMVVYSLNSRRKNAVGDFIRYLVGE
jgi:hypothetical protein